LLFISPFITSSNNLLKIFYFKITQWATNQTFMLNIRPRLGRRDPTGAIILCAVGRPILAAHSNLPHKNFSGKFVAAHRGFDRRARLSSPGRRNTIVFNFCIPYLLFASNSSMHLKNSTLSSLYHQIKNGNRNKIKCDAWCWE
jgi:hypothetical protein